MIILQVLVARLDAVAGTVISNWGRVTRSIQQVGRGWAPDCTVDRNDHLL